MSLAPDRVYGQYRTKPKAVQWYDIVPSIAQPICDAAEQVQATYDIDTQVGVQLDIIGAILVINRNLVSDIQQIVFECGDEEAECGDPEVMCSPQIIFGTDTLTDEEYRLVLKSKIVKNNSPATIDDLIEGITFILTTPTNLVILDFEDMSFAIQVDQTLTPLERELILTKNIIPKPQGVRFAGLIELTDVVQCGDDTLECGDPEAECAGFTII